MVTIRYECSAFPALHVGSLQFVDGVIITSDPYEQDVLDRSAYAWCFRRIVINPPPAGGDVATDDTQPTAEEASSTTITLAEATSLAPVSGARDASATVSAPDADGRSAQTEPVVAGSASSHRGRRRGRT